jgi:phospholipid/cholesterol/gamma-HCH transport system substrate-binding protein
MLGVNVGRVMEFRIGPAGQGVEIELEIEGQYRVPRDSRVRLRSAGVLGGTIADIVPGRAPEPLRGGEVLAGVEGEAEGASFDELTSKADDVMARVQGLLSEKMVGDVHASGAELREVLKALSSTVKEQRQQVQGLTASLRRNSESLEKTTGAGELDRAVKRLDEITRKADELTGSLDRTSKSMESILGRIERGEGTLGRLSRDDRLYDSLAEAATSLRQTSLDVGKLIEEIRKNPRKYLKVSVF